MSRLPAATSAPVGGTFVFDSSAMLAYLKGEIGGPLVASILGDTTATIYAHSTNLVEVRYNFGPPSGAGISAKANAAIVQLKAAGVQERRDNDSAFFEDVALLVAEARALPPSAPGHKSRLALGDAFGVALARRVSGEIGAPVPFVTADQGEIVPLQTALFCTALFIR